ncbi:MAG: hypothetical protein HZB65_01575 [Candidatus Aenigmarchaeota archaeon]|nr:hypothetical protein [Candidatus Aenigmarchaeota archaeon]
MNYKITQIGIGFPCRSEDRSDIACGYAALDGERIVYFGSAEELVKALGIDMDDVIACDVVCSDKRAPIKIIYDPSIKNDAKIISNGSMPFEEYAKAVASVFPDTELRAEHMGRIMDELCKIY